MTPINYEDSLYAKSRKVADVFEGTLNNIFIEGFDPSLCHSFR